MSRHFGAPNFKPRVLSSFESSSSDCRNRFMCNCHLMNLLKEMQSFDILSKTALTFYCKLFGDNAGAIQLQPRFRSKLNLPHWPVSSLPWMGWGLWSDRCSSISFWKSSGLMTKLLDLAFSSYWNDTQSCDGNFLCVSVCLLLPEGVWHSVHFCLWISGWDPRRTERRDHRVMYLRCYTSACDCLELLFPLALDRGLHLLVSSISWLLRQFMYDR
jgi:hypothetical protein